MFTGIVEELGSVAELARSRLAVACRTVTDGSPIGASVAVNGVCITVVERTADGLAFDLSEETVARTAVASLRPGDPVNLERPMALAGRLSGHLVQGHVDGVGTVRSLQRNEGGAVLSVQVPTGLFRYLVDKGSVAVDGVSLTVAGRDGDGFWAALIPHTLEVTTLGTVQPGSLVNLEVDVIAKYVENLLYRDRIESAP
jgi:riboflavin synthase